MTKVVPARQLLVVVAVVAAAVAWTLFYLLVLPDGSWRWMIWVTCALCGFSELRFWRSRRRDRQER